MNENCKVLLQKIVDLIPLDDCDIEYIKQLNDKDKLLIIITYMETLNQIIKFMEEFL
jgi:hypothetical protein